MTIAYRNDNRNIVIVNLEGKNTGTETNSRMLIIHPGRCLHEWRMHIL